MSLSDITGLRETIARHLDRDDLAGDIDTFIRLAEARHQRDIRIQEMLTRAALTVDDRYVDIPTGLLEAKTIRLLTNPRTVLDNKANHEMDRVSREGTGKPRSFTVHAQIEFDTFPDQSFSGEIIYFAALTLLDDTNPVNALLTRAPDAYLYGSLLASAPFLGDDPRIQVWAGLYGEITGALKLRDRTRIGPQVAVPHGPTP